VKTYTIQRLITGDAGTFGLLTLQGGQVLHTGELPWRDNAPDISCVPAGSYEAVLAFSPHFQRSLFHLEGVPGRTNCMIHPANWMGDASKGLKCQLEGCIALGMGEGQLEGQEALISSQEAIQVFYAEAGLDPITVIILDARATV